MAAFQAANGNFAFTASDVHAIDVSPVSLPLSCSEVFARLLKVRVRYMSVVDAARGHEEMAQAAKVLGGPIFPVKDTMIGRLRQPEYALC